MYLSEPVEWRKRSRKTYHGVSEIDDGPSNARRTAENGENGEPSEEEGEYVGDPDAGVCEPLCIPVEIRRRRRLYIQIRHESGIRSNFDRKRGGIGVSCGCSIVCVVVDGHLCVLRVIDGCSLTMQIIDSIHLINPTINFHIPNTSPIPLTVNSTQPSEFAPQTPIKPYSAYNN
ncbi:hypothetical protein LXL04_026275 [Taraxacum kok-saghyz]